MEKLKLIFSILYFLSLVVLSIILIGCGSATRIIDREVKIPYEVTIKDTITLKDTIINDEPVWTGEVVDSLNNVIGSLKVYYRKKLAELTISKRDTVRKIDTLYIEQPFNDFLKETSVDFSLTEKIILYGAAGLLISILMVYRRKKNVIGKQ